MRLFLLVILLVGSFIAKAGDSPDPQTIALTRADATLAADFHPSTATAEPGAPVILLLHMLNSNRAAYAPLIPDLREAGYAILNIDLRGHGDSGGPRDWDLAINDVALGWISWLAENDHLSESGLAIIGGSIGANVALISCAQVEVCRGAIALSPGLDYRGVKPESALVDGLADRAALLVASQNDASSSTAIRQMFLNAKGDVTARLYRGRAHDTRLFDSEYDSVSVMIIAWLAELFEADGE
ncbi:MAG: alpha/beta fold hydrolase [Chloroflexi bacterium]|nr:alpha/beta fold hydrolase [Chloroflexota bacterium]